MLLPQDGSHDSVIDARAALDLAKLKIKHGPSWGTSDGRPFNALAEVLAEQGAKCCLVDRPDVLHRYGPGNVVTIPVYSDAQAAEAAAHHCSSGKYNFVWTQFTELAAFYQQRAAALRQGAEADRAKAATEGKEAAKAKAATEDKEEEEDEDSDEEAVEVVAGKRAAGGGEEAAGRAVKRRRLQQEEGAGAGAAVLAQSDSSSSEEEEEKAAQQGPGSSLPDRLKEQLARLDARVAQVYDAAPPNTLVIVATGVGDSAEAERLTELMCKRQQGLLDGLPPWSVADEDAHAAFLEEQLLGLAFIAVKQ